MSESLPAALHVVAFGAHPDDAEAQCGGFLAQEVRRGRRVAICDLSRGELSSNGTPEERQQEAQAAAAVLGVHRVTLDLPDGGLDGRDPAQVAEVVRFLRRVRPRLVIAPHAAARHPDHQAAHELVRRARFFCAVARFAPDVPPAARPLLWFAADYHPIEPTFVVNIEDALETKLAALRCHASQFAQGPGRVATHLNAAAYLQRVETQARAYGARIHCRAGEAFVSEQTLALADPYAAVLGDDPPEALGP